MSNYLSIKDIRDQVTREGKEISIPAIQRGLVWNAKQVEYLWDSILREFPVGGFVVLENEKTLDLLDGQQRYNAIKLAFVEPSEADSEVLWWDIRQDRKESSRKYFVKVVSKEQPWGYKNDEDCSRLSAQERREALNVYFRDEKFNVYKDDFEIAKVFPFEAQFPIPMSFLLKTNNLYELINKIETLPDSWKERHWTPEKQRLLGEKYKDIKSKIDKLLDEYSKYSIPLSVLSKDLLDEDDTEPQENSAIEVLFNRLGSMGTRITNEDLAYSAIKSYWPKDIKEKNEELAEGLLPPQVLISLLFRLILTEENAKELTRGLSINQIRKIAGDEDKKKSIIDFFKSEEPDRIISLLKKCLDDMNIPPYLIVKMGRDIPDAMLLIMWIIHKYEIKETGQKYLAGLLLLLLWFGNKGKITSIVDNLYKIIQSFQSEQFDFGAVSHAVYSMMGFEWISVIYSPEELLTTLTVGDKVINELENNPMGISLSGLWWDRSMLLYAQREFLDAYFPLYNPMDVKRWKEDNCPWDYDHILPQSWVYRQKGVAQTFKDWEYTIGNLAAIPFEENRSKNDKSDYKFYKENQESLFFDERFESFTPESVKDKEKACIFAKTVFDRFVRIYRECYNAISILLSGIEADGAKKTKDMYESLKKGMQENKHNLKARFVLAGREYDIVNPVDWNRQWISFEYDLNNYCVASISFSKMNNNQADSECEYEIGLRKHPLLLNVSNEWRKNNESKILQIAEKAGLQEEGGQGWWYILKTCKSFEEAKECFYKIIEAE